MLSPDLCFLDLQYHMYWVDARNSQFEFQRVRQWVWLICAVKLESGPLEISTRRLSIDEPGMLSEKDC
jgi:hypothetical protein